MTDNQKLDNRLTKLEGSVKYIAETVDEIKKNINSVSNMRTDIAILSQKDNMIEFEIKVIRDQQARIEGVITRLWRTVGTFIILGVLGFVFASQVP